MLGTSEPKNTLPNGGETWWFTNGRISKKSPKKPIQETEIRYLEKNIGKSPIWVFPKIGYPQIIHEKIGFSIIFTIHFGGSSPYFWKHPYGEYSDKGLVASG